MRLHKRSLLFLLGGLFLAALIVAPSLLIDAQALRELLARCGAWAPAAYIAAFTVLPALFFPVAVLALAGGLLFGLWQGSIYTFAGALLNCTLMFLLARSVGRQRVDRLIQEQLSPQWQARLERAGGREGFLLLVVLRLIPAVPYNLINYAFGLSGMPLGAYLLASAVGIIPGTLAFINIGDKSLDAGSPAFWRSIALILALLLVTAFLGKKLFPPSAEKKEDHHEKTGTHKP